MSIIKLIACLAFMQLLFPLTTETGYVCSKSKTKCSSYTRDKSPEWSEISYHFRTINWSCAFLYHHHKYAQTETERHVFVQILKHVTILKSIRSICTHTHSLRHTINQLVTSYWQLFLLFKPLLPSITSATFPLTFAYISDCVEDKKKRAPAFGLALATFGLSFCLGPVSGSYLAKQFGDKSVFLTSFVLVLVNISYIVFFLPETVKVQVPADVRTYVPFE